MRKKLLTNGNVFKRTDSRWGGVVWYMDEQTSYDRLEGTARCQIYPLLGDKVVDGSIVPFINDFPTDTELYKLMSTKPGEN